MRSSLFALALFAVACSSDPVAPDASASSDAAARSDASPAQDAAPSADDAAVAPDATLVADAEPAMDVDPSADAAPIMDAAPGMDAAPARDAGAGMDAAPSMDASGAGVDSGVVCGPNPSAAPDPSMSFFVTSTGNGSRGGDLGGLAGADAKCQCLAAAVGRGGRTWRAYLSTSPAAGAGALVHARDRIGLGPWFNYQGAQIAANVGALHATPPTHTLILTEYGGVVPRAEHDILTGSDAEGRSFAHFPDNPAAPPPTCANWTDGTDNTYGFAGHADWDDGMTQPSWNSSHGAPCSQTGLQSTAGAARLYCFAID